MNKKTFLLLIFILVLIDFAFGQTNDYRSTEQIVTNGVGLGSIIAVVTSWSRNKSVGWAILHGLFSWLYVIYFVLTRNSEI